MERRVKKKVKRYRTIDEAGVSLARVFGDRTAVKLTEETGLLSRSRLLDR